MNDKILSPLRWLQSVGASVGCGIVQIWQIQSPTSSWNRAENTLPTYKYSSLCNLFDSRNDREYALEGYISLQIKLITDKIQSCERPRGWHVWILSDLYLILQLREWYCNVIPLNSDIAPSVLQWCISQTLQWSQDQICCVQCSIALGSFKSDSDGFKCIDIR